MSTRRTWWTGLALLLAAPVVLCAQVPDTLSPQAQDSVSQQAYETHRAELVKQLQETQNQLSELRSQRVQLEANVENALARAMQGRAQMLLMSPEQNALVQLDGLLATAQDGEAFNIFCTHQFLAQFQPWLQEKSKELLPRGVQVKVLVTSPSEDPIFIKIRNFEVKASQHSYVFAAGMNVMGNFIGFWNEMDSLAGMLMENAHLARMQRAMFEQAWTQTA